MNQKRRNLKPEGFQIGFRKTSSHLTIDQGVEQLLEKISDINTDSDTVSLAKEVYLYFLCEN
jgi:hypothetical protein